MNLDDQALTATRTQHLTLTMSGGPELLRVARLAARSVGTDAGLDVSDIDELALAVDELSAALMDVATGEVQVRISRDTDGSVTVEGEGSAPEGLRLSGIAVAILERTTDRYSIVSDGTVSGFFMVVKPRDGIG